MKNKLIWLEALLVIGPFIAVALLWNQVPDRIPIHWNIHGEIDGWAGKAVGLLFAPIIGFASVAFLHAVSWLDPKLRRNLKPGERMHGILQVLRVAAAGLFDVILLVQIVSALGRPLPTARVLIITILVFFAVIGNYLGNLRPNYFIGIRTPWTLENSETWRATHRLGARSMFSARSCC
jgi:immunity protein, SdpI family